MKVLILFCLFFAVGVNGDCDKSKCPTVPVHYAELGCKPVISSGECCAKSFDCAHLDTRSDSKCYFKGKVYEPNTSVDDNALKGLCIGAARCRDHGKIIYAHKDCAEFFSRSMPNDCIRQYSIDKCCSTGTLCGDTVTRLKTCNFEGKTYRTGQKMYSEVHEAHTCFCTDDFNANLPIANNPNCRKPFCSLELTHSEDIKNKCVPVYHKDSYCPSNWRCPSDADAVAAGARHNSPGPKCKFGKLEFSVGDSLAAGDNPCQKCTCSIPPLLTCSFVDCE